jgi:hypothetical protein
MAIKPSRSTAVFLISYRRKASERRGIAYLVLNRLQSGSALQLSSANAKCSQLPERRARTASATCLHSSAKLVTSTVISASFVIHQYRQNSSQPKSKPHYNMSRYRAHSGTCDQILLSVRRFFSESCCLVSVGRPL